MGELRQPRDPPQLTQHLRGGAGIPTRGGLGQSGGGDRMGLERAADERARTTGEVPSACMWGRVGHLERKVCFTKRCTGPPRAHGERRRRRCLREACLDSQVSQTRCGGELDRPDPQSPGAQP